MDEAWRVIHSSSAGDEVQRDIFSLSALVLTSYHLMHSKICANLDLPTDLVVYIRRQLDLSLIIGTSLFTTPLLKFVDLLAPKHDFCDVSHPSDLLSRRVAKNPPQLSSNTVSRWQSISFLKFKSLGTPFIIEGSIKHWPANRNWRSRSYLRKLIGHRTIPVEVGTTYLDDSWRIELISGSEYLDNFLERSSDEIGYMAQVRLFDLVPALRDDIVVPDLALLMADEDDIQINAWLGPPGTITPCHHDPYDNFLCQVIGSKYIRLYSPAENAKMYPSGESSVKNSSLVDIMNPDYERFPLHNEAHYQDCILSEGDMLYIPHGWWHYVESLENSFSVSFWWSP